MPEFDSHITLILSIVAAIISGAIGIRRAQALWSKDGTNIANSEALSAGAGAQRAIIEMMRQEMERMGVSNKQMMMQLDEFQKKNIQLSAEVSMLTAQISSFQLQNSELQIEISSLRAMLKEWNEKNVSN